MRAKIKKLNGVFPVTLDKAVYITGTKKKLDEKLEELSKIASNGYKIYNIKDYGAKGDGLNDDGKAIISAIADLPEEKFCLYIPDGLYMHGDGSYNTEDYEMGEDGPISDPNIGTPNYFLFENKHDFIVLGTKDSLIKAHPDMGCIINNRPFDFNKCSNFEVREIHYDGNIEARQPAMKDYSQVNRQSGITIDACKNFKIIDSSFNNTCMDGIFIGSQIWGETKIVTNGGLIKNVQCNYNYRQGMSVVNARNLIVESSEFSYTGTKFYTSPGAGIDFEEGYINPLRGQINITVRDCKVVDNKGGGILPHWGTSNFLMERCYLENNSVNVPTDSEAMNINATYRDNIFVNCALSSDAGGEHIINNTFILNNDTQATAIKIADSKKWTEKGICRQPVIKGNVIKCDPTAAMAKTDGRIGQVWTYDVPDVVFEGNIIENAYSNNIGLYDFLEIASCKNNTIIWNHDEITTTNVFKVLKAREISGNKVIGPIQNNIDKVEKAIGQATNIIEKSVEMQNLTQNKAIDISLSGTIVSLELTYHDAYPTQRVRKELYNFDFFKNARKKELIYQIDEGVMQLRSSQVYKKNDVNTITICNLSSEAQTTQISVRAFCRDRAKNSMINFSGIYDYDSSANLDFKLVYKHMEGKSLPSTNDYVLKNGDTFFNTTEKIVYKFNGNIWIPESNEITPELFGAKGDNNTDDTVAIQKAIDYLDSAKGGVLKLSEGKTYILGTISNNIFLQLKSNITIQGNATFKVKNVIGDYKSIFNFDNCSNLVLKDFTVDENTTNNVKTGETGNTNKERITFYGWIAPKNCEFDNITINDCIGKWQITVGDTNKKSNNIKINNIKVNFHDSTNLNLSYDRTSIYLGGTNIQLSNCELNAGANNNGLTAVEMHGDFITMEKCNVINYTSGVFVVNDKECSYQNTNLEIKNNNIKAKNGIQLWFSLSDRNVDTIEISNNKIKFETIGVGTFANNGANSIFSNILINNNILESDTPDGAPFKFYEANSTVLNSRYENVNIENNIIRGRTGRLLSLASEPENKLEFNNFTLRNNNYTSTSSAIFGIINRDNINNLLIEHNKFNIENVTASAIHGGTVSGITMRNNNISKAVLDTLLSLTVPILLIDSVPGFSFIKKEIGLITGLISGSKIIGDSSELNVINVEGTRVYDIKAKVNNMPTHCYLEKGSIISDRSTGEEKYATNTGYLPDKIISTNNKIGEWVQYGLYVHKVLKDNNFDVPDGHPEDFQYLGEKVNFKPVAIGSGFNTSDVIPDEIMEVEI